MSIETSQVVKLMIKSGTLVPDNVLQQLKGWKLLPEGYVESIGNQDNISLEKEWPTVEGFLKDLQEAIQDEAATIRETVLDQHGGYDKAWVSIAGLEDRMMDIFVDRMGRVVFPPDQKFEEVTFVKLVEGPRQKVLKTEPRYKGGRRSAWVCYLESEENNVEVVDAVGEAESGENTGSSEGDGGTPI